MAMTPQESIDKLIFNLDSIQLKKYDELVSLRLESQEYDANLKNILEIAQTSINNRKKDFEPFQLFVSHALEKAEYNNIISKEEKQALENNKIILKQTHAIKTWENVEQNWDWNLVWNIHYKNNTPLDSTIHLIYWDRFVNHKLWKPYQKNMIEQLIFHELGHIRYFKDTNKDTFENICWQDKDKTNCDFIDFVSQYASSNALEDYAETFSFVNSSRFNNNNKEKYLELFKDSNKMKEKIEYMKSVKAN